MKMFPLNFATLLLLVLNAVEYSSCEQFNIVPSPDSPCPGEFTGEPCLTLQQYVANYSSIDTDITFELYPGYHILDSQLRVSNINSFTMNANASESTTIACNQQLGDPFYFNRLQQVHISGIAFVGCRMNLQYVVNASLEQNSFLKRNMCCQRGAAVYALYSSVLVRLCNISNNTVNRGAIYSQGSTFIVEQSTFRDNYYPNDCCSRGGAICV